MNETVSTIYNEIGRITVLLDRHAIEKGDSEDQFLLNNIIMEGVHLQSMIASQSSDKKSFNSKNKCPIMDRALSYIKNNKKRIKNDV